MSSRPIAQYLLPDTAELKNDDVFIGGVSLTALANQYGTPLFVYDELTLRRRAADAASVFDAGVAYASKAFLCGAMARLAVEEGLWIDVATEGELDLVLRSGVPAEKIVVHGNNKSRAEINRALDVGVHRIVVDNFDEIELLRELVSSTRPVSCLLRVIPGVEAHTHEFVQTGQEDSKFGLSITRGDAEEGLRRMRSIEGLHVAGLHSHIGSQIFEVSSFLKALEIVATFAREEHVEEICVGGGLGIAYVEGEQAPSLSEWGAAVRAEALRLFGPDVRITAEPGRSIVGSAAVTIYRVGARKEVADRTYLAVDGGMSDNPRPVLYGSGYEAFALRSPQAERLGVYRVVGKHCESGDVLIDEAALPLDVATGDLIVTPVTGAYGYSMASNYNRVTKPAVVFVRDGVATLVLRRETLDDLIRLEF
ncbi:MAG: diaminopimelate decarboxylase [Actinomycetota bacterium]